MGVGVIVGVAVQAAAVAVNAVAVLVAFWLAVGPQAVSKTMSKRDRICMRSSRSNNLIKVFPHLSVMISRASLYLRHALSKVGLLFW